MSVPKWLFEFSEIPPKEQVNVTIMLRDWHRARLLGAELSALSRDGVRLSENALLRLNLWISSGGAWNASRGDFFRAWDRLERIIASPVDPANLAHPQKVVRGTP